MNKENNLEKWLANNFNDIQDQIGIHHDTLFLFSNLVIYSCGCLILSIYLDGGLGRLVGTHSLRIIGLLSQGFDRSISLKTSHQMAFRYSLLYLWN